MIFALVLLFGLQAANPAHAVTRPPFTVNSTGDAVDEDPGNGTCRTATAGECTLRAAIQEANATSGADTIDFNIPSTGSTITPTSALPDITSPVTIDGYTQGDGTPGDPSDDATENTLAQGTNAVLKIELSGASIPAASFPTGLKIMTANSTVKGLIINRWGVGVRISGSDATGNNLVGNYVGTSPSGTADLGNTQHGVVIEDGAANNTVGETIAGARNTISGNDDVGVWITSTAGTGNKVQGNYIGTNAAGDTILANNLGVAASSANNTIGGTVAGARNIISGNGYGVQILGPDNKVQGNYIGINADGTTPLGNNVGVEIDSVADNTIGGTTAAARNVISGNSTFGIRISYTGATGNTVQGNYIGTDVAGTVTDPDGIPNNGDELGNGNDGVRIQADADDNTIGGKTAGADNIISGNGGDGVEVRFDSGVDLDAATGNSILSNSIYDNHALGIDLVHSNDPAGVTLNDDGDGDGGIPPDPASAPNRLQNFPVITSAKLTTKRIGGHRRKVTLIKGTLNSEADKSYTVQFFGSPEADNPPNPPYTITGYGEGKTFLGHKSVTTNSSGDATFTFITRKKVPIGQVLTATATNQTTGDTSEFSKACTVPGVPCP